LFDYFAAKYFACDYTGPSSVFNRSWLLVVNAPAVVNPEVASYFTILVDIFFCAISSYGCLLI
jgi:hypothetical protein